MRITLELHELLEAKLNRLLDCEGQGEALQSRVLGLLEEILDERLQDFPDDWTIEMAFSDLGEHSATW